MITHIYRTNQTNLAQHKVLASPQSSRISKYRLTHIGNFRHILFYVELRVENHLQLAFGEYDMYYVIIKYIWCIDYILLYANQYISIPCRSNIQAYLLVLHDIYMKLC